jgi:hypothetical protein
MPPTDLAAWTVIGLLTAANDLAMTQRRLDGKLGEQARAAYLHTAQVVGGVRNLIIIGVIGDLLLWPLCLGASLHAWHRDRRTRQAELAAAAGDPPPRPEHGAP